MKPYYISIKEEVDYERQFYSEEFERSDWNQLKEGSELFLIHAYSHLFETPVEDYDVFGDMDYAKKYSQFYLNLAVGLELLFKSLLLKKGIKINRQSKKGINYILNPEQTISFGTIIYKYLNEIFPKLIGATVEEIKNTLVLINLRRNNIAHCSKRSLDHYAHEYRFSYITLHIYEKFFMEVIQNSLIYY